MAMNAENILIAEEENLRQQNLRQSTKDAENFMGIVCQRRRIFKEQWDKNNNCTQIRKN